MVSLIFNIEERNKNSGPSELHGIKNNYDPASVCFRTLPPPLNFSPDNFEEHGPLTTDQKAIHMGI